VGDSTANIAGPATLLMGLQFVRSLDSETEHQKQRDIQTKSRKCDVCIGLICLSSYRIARQHCLGAGKYFDSEKWRSQYIRDLRPEF
jgi:hypothetical protein